jgi:hypothetical protein
VKDSLPSEVNLEELDFLSKKNLVALFLSMKFMV